MKKAILIELAWLAGLFVLAFLAASWVIANDALDVAEHDMYVANGGNFSMKWPIVFAFFLSLGFVVYLVKAICFKFKAIVVNILLIAMTCVLLLEVESINATEAYYFSSAFFSNPVSTAAVKGLFYGADPSVLFCLRFFPWLKMILVITVIFAGFMTGRLSKSRR